MLWARALRGTGERQGHEHTSPKLHLVRDRLCGGLAERKGHQGPRVHHRVAPGRVGRCGAAPSRQAAAGCGRGVRTQQQAEDKASRRKTRRAPNAQQPQQHRCTRCTTRRLTRRLLDINELTLYNYVLQNVQLIPKPSQNNSCMNSNSQTPPGNLYISTRSAASGTRKPAAPPVHADHQTQDHGQKSTSPNRWPLFGGCVVGSLSA